MAVPPQRVLNRLPTVTVRINRRNFSFDLTSLRGVYTRIVCKGVVHDGAVQSECPLIPEGDFNPETSKAAWARFRAECSFDRTTGAIIAISDRLIRLLLAMVRITIGRDVTDKEIVLPSSRESGVATAVLKGIGNDLMYGMIPDAPYKGSTARVFARVGFKKPQGPTVVCQSPLHKGPVLPTKRSALMSNLRHKIPMCVACLDKHTNRYLPSSTVGKHRLVVVLRQRFRPVMQQLLERVLESDESRMIAGMIGPRTPVSGARLFLAAPFLCFIGGLVEPAAHFVHVIPFTPEPLRQRTGRPTVDRGMPLIVMDDDHSRRVFYKTFMADCGPGQLRTTAVCMSISSIMPGFEVPPLYSIQFMASDISRLLLYAPFIELFAAILAGKLTTPITLRVTARGIGAATAAETDARIPPYSLTSVQPTITAAECLVPELLHAALERHDHVVVAGSLDASLNDPHIDSFADGFSTTGLLAILARASFSAELSGQITLDTAIGGDLLPDNPTERDHAVLRATQTFLAELDAECPDTTLPFSDESIVPKWSMLMQEIFIPVLPVRYPESVHAEVHRSVLTPSPEDTRRRPRARPVDTEAQELEAEMFGSESPEPSPGTQWPQADAIDDRVAADVSEGSSRISTGQDHVAGVQHNAAEGRRTDMLVCCDDNRLPNMNTTSAVPFYGGADEHHGDPGEHSSDTSGPSDDSRDGIVGSDSTDDALGDLGVLVASTKRPRFA